ncbi:hypothetical protein BDV95DRAFT_600283 [Massariosphaeria phaeospora]|uniref:Uncharacterized protein n=1 Tax=Massariosphaeria phaeospora TaxID=100035 RepID=A0A7C8M3M6_9PLEO|nr:hypothetical protein BDV95DRAFT_600283 [Massariosphaeria phaeospora]
MADREAQKWTDECKAPSRELIPTSSLPSYSGARTLPACSCERLPNTDNRRTKLISPSPLLKHSGLVREGADNEDSNVRVPWIRASCRAKKYSCSEVKQRRLVTGARENLSILTGCIEALSLWFLIFYSKGYEVAIANHDHNLRSSLERNLPITRPAGSLKFESDITQIIR